MSEVGDCRRDFSIWRRSERVLTRWVMRDWMRDAVSVCGRLGVSLRSGRAEGWVGCFRSSLLGARCTNSNKDGESGIV